MKKYTLLLIGILISHLAFSQIQSGEITYKVRPPKKNIIDTSKVKDQLTKEYFAKEFNKVKKAAPYLSFTLTFNTHEAIFQRPNYMSNDNGMDLNLTAMVSGVEGSYYSSTEKNINLHQFETIEGNNNWLVKTKIDEFYWKISDETRNIQGYLCQKATANINLNCEVKGIVTAWFCPDLPFQFGPIGFSKLPGLILGLERNGFYFYAKNIKLYKKEKAIKKPTKGKEVTWEEYCTETEYMNYPQN